MQIDKKKLRIAIIVSHPIQHFCPQYVSFAKINYINCKIFFASALGYKKYFDPSFGKEISWGNLHLDKFDHHFLNGDAILPSDHNLDAITLESDLNTYAPDIIIIYGYFQKLQRRARKWAINNGVKIGYISDSEHKHDLSFIKEKVKGFFIRKYFSKIDLFLSVGDANEEYYKLYGVKSEKIIRMHFPIDIYQYQVSYINREVLRQKIRKEYNIKEKEIVISVAGKLVSWKSQEKIIAAMELLEKSHIYMTLFIIGSGKELPVLIEKSKNLKNSKVYFPGFVTIENLPAYYAASDMYVHPALIEPHSIAISEAIYMQCPVIISDKCGSYGLNDDVQDGKNGFVYNYDNINNLAEKIMQLVNNENLRKSFGEYSHTISLKFQETAHKLVIEKIYNRLSNGMQ